MQKLESGLSHNLAREVVSKSTDKNARVRAKAELLILAMSKHPLFGCVLICNSLVKEMPSIPTNIA